jgi:hypothetical protein
MSNKNGIEAKQAKLKDSNVSDIGSQTDKDVRLKAAKTEDAWVRNFELISKRKVLAKLQV